MNHSPAGEPDGSNPDRKPRPTSPAPKGGVDGNLQSNLEPAAEVERIAQSVDQLVAGASPGELAAAAAPLREMAASATDMAQTVKQAIGRDIEAAESSELDSLLDGVFEDVAAVLGSVDSLSTEKSAAPKAHNNVPMAASTAVQTAPAGPSAVTELASVDESTAAELDTLLSAGFDTVDDVLQVVFDKQASKVGAPSLAADSIEAVAPGTSVTVEVPVAPVAQAIPAPAKEAPKVAVVAAPTVVVAPIPTGPKAQPAATQVPASKASAPPAPVAASSASPSLASNKTASPAPTAAVEQPNSPPVATPPPKKPLIELFVRMDAPLRATLSQLNYPLRFMPPAARRTVDFVALTMVIWVPIVWFVALFVL
jgi:hypothetical protein